MVHVGMLMGNQIVTSQLGVDEARRKPCEATSLVIGVPDGMDDHYSQLCICI